MKRPEQDLQRACVALLANMERMGHLRFFHIPNGGKRNAREAAIFKGLGVRPGVPDLCITYPSGRTIWIELKAGRGTLTANQKEWRDWLKNNGHDWHEVRSIDELQDVVRPVLGMDRVQAAGRVC